MIRLFSILMFVSGCSFVLIDEPCDTAAPAPSDDTGETTVPLFVALGTGAVHSCGIRDDGSLQCWGGGEDGQLDVPEGLFTDLAVGHAHACALDLDGGVQCWGRNTDGQTDLSGEFIALSLGAEHSCGLDASGIATCVGRNDRGQTDVPEHTFSSIAAGATHTCGIIESRKGSHSTCWGSLSKEPAEDEDHKVVISGTGWSCLTSDLLDTDRAPECLGDNSSGQLEVPSQSVTMAWTAGARHGCGLSDGGLLTCWGANDAAQVEVPDGEFSAVSAGPTALHTCAIAAVDDSGVGPAVCWGLDAENQLEP